ncbi:hypothetical protein [Palleronia sediminis]|uniref:hypothetical protein n=1 Tax=Palleronia sediminis TaxID=2547833 RepID=UPI0014559687|nr:hypothetical protein [Palleronia sediminis]
MTRDSDKTKSSDFGISHAEPGKTGKTPLDKPSTGDEDFAIDERRDKPIRGPEPHDDD